MTLWLVCSHSIKILGLIQRWLSCVEFECSVLLGASPVGAPVAQLNQKHVSQVDYKSVPSIKCCDEDQDLAPGQCLPTAPQRKMGKLQRTNFIACCCVYVTNKCMLINTEIFYLFLNWKKHYQKRILCNSTIIMRLVT